MQFFISLGITLLGALIAILGVYTYHSTGLIVIGFVIALIGILFRPR